MTLSKKFMLTTAALALSGSMLTSPAAAQTPPTESKNFMAAIFKKSLDQIAEKYVEKYFYLMQLHQRAIDTNNTALLAHTQPALAEVENRQNKICAPLVQKLEIAYNEQLIRYPKFSDPLDPNFKQLALAFESSCSAGLLPNVWVSKTGAVTSDVKIPLKQYGLERLEVLMASDKRAMAAIDEVERSSKTSGAAYVERMYKVAKAAIAADKACISSGKSYEQALISKSVPQIRWRRESFLNACTHAA